MLAILLVWLVRRRGPPFAWTLVGTVLLLGGFIVRLAAVEPVNVQVARALEAAPDAAASIWTPLKDRWEFGHAAGFVFQLLGFAALLVSVLVETQHRADARATTAPDG